MSSTTERLSPTVEPFNIHPALLRLDVTPVPQTAPSRAECGFTSYARTLAQQLCATMHGRTWLAATRAPTMPDRRVASIADVTVIVDRRRLITVHQFTPAGDNLRDTWTIYVNCRPIPHRTFTGEVPHQVGPITRSLWRHLNNVQTDPCDTLGCTAPATLATYRHLSLCTACVARFRQAGR
ncbi:hypothetical protein [Dactylosporangium darangshiense]|uniref:Uncharacterized protein n=1 Tax=Dactylosporangium darangshiense TaxID=579108 RepID=A0ABP8DI87_9ACTN